MTIPITSITIPASRQRTRPSDITWLKESIRVNGLINPITLRQGEDNHPTLVAGRNRLQSLIDLGRESLSPGEYRFWEDLGPDEAEVIELEENVKRDDLHWRDAVAAYGKIHDLKSSRAKTAGAPWSIEATANYLALSKGHLSKVLTTYRNLSSPLIADADTFEQAFSRLQRDAERRAINIVNELASVGMEAFTGEGHGQGHGGIYTAGESQVPPDGDENKSILHPITPTTAPAQNPAALISHIPAAVPKTSAVLNLDFLSWAEAYSGPKFTFIHCDFPYGIDYTNYGNTITQTGPGLYAKDQNAYFHLLDGFCLYLDHFCSYSAHVMFWFSMVYYTPTKRRLESAGLTVIDHPLIWHKTCNTGNVPGKDNSHLRRVYETAFIATRGKRPFVKLISNAYGAPTQPNAIFPSIKPEPVLRHFFQATIDSTTDVLDPTTGSGSALIAAEDLGAKTVLGLELDANFTRDANIRVETARTKRRMSGGI